jgi:hypothetical protein
MRHKFLNNIRRVLNNINISPIDPRVLWLQRRIQQVIPRTANPLPPRPLRVETVPIINALIEIGTKVFLDDFRSAEFCRISPFL